MDDKCERALRGMGFEDNVVNIFREKKIDYETLLLLREYRDEIEAILPSIPLQLKLRKGLDSLPKDQTLETPELTVASTSLSGSAGADLTGGLLVSSDITPANGPVVLFDDALPIINTIPAQSVEKSGAGEVQTTKRRRVDSINSSVDGDQPVSTEQESTNDILRILNKSVISKLILSTYKSRGFDNASRCKLAELVIDDAYDCDPNKSLTCAKLLTLAKKIVELFPGECVETYYVASSSRGKGLSASGKLYDSYTNINRDLRKLGLRNIYKSVSVSKSGNTGTSATVPLANPNDVEVQRALEFLTIHLDPWDLVKENWEISCGARLKALRDPDNTEFRLTCQYINKFPALKQPGGHMLLEYDFGVLFKDAKDRMVNETWSEFATKLRTELNRCGIKETESEAELLFNFPRLFSVVPVKVPGKKPWRASRVEIQKGFIVHIKALGNFEKELSDLKNLVSQKGTQLQPFPLIVGENLKNIESSYVVIDERPFRVESPKRAVEVAFKTYHALYCDYPVQSERVWVVLQKALFDINEDLESSVKSAPEVLRLISALKVN